MRTSNIVAPFVVLLAAPALAQPVPGEEIIEPDEEELAELRGLTPEGVARDVAVINDELEPVAEFNTKPVWENDGGFTDRVRADNFLRAFVQKQSGEARYQLYQRVTYSGDWRRFRTVSYLTEDGPVSADLTVIEREVVTCSGGLCVYREIVGFDIPQRLMEEIGAGYEQGASDMWRFRLKAQGGLDWEDRIAPAEAAGLMRAVEAWRAGRGQVPEDPVGDGRGEPDPLAANNGSPT